MTTPASDLRVSAPARRVKASKVRGSMARLSQRAAHHRAAACPLPRLESPRAR